MISVEVIGVEELKSDLRKYGRDAEKVVKNVVARLAITVQSTAKARLNGLMDGIKRWKTGRLQSSITRMKQYEKDQFEAIVGTDVEYAPYIEFGTGDLVEIPEGAEDVASQYKGKGIRKVNIRAMSFLNYAAVKNAKKFYDTLVDELNRLNK